MSVGTTAPTPAEGQLEAPSDADPDIQLAEGGGSKSPLKIAMTRLMRDPVAMISLGMALFFVLVAVFADQLSGLEGQNTTDLNLDLIGDNTYPIFTANTEHWFGISSGLGQDLFARWVHGSRPSLIIAVASAAGVTIIGVLLGLLSGFLGGWVDRIISWIIDFLLSLPFLLFAIAIVPIAVNRYAGTQVGDYVDEEKVAPFRLLCLLVVFLLFGWCTLARLIRGEVLSLREREFVQAARALGVPTRVVLFKEMLPNMLGPIIVSLSLAIPGYVSAEAGLSFLGVGLRSPSISWGLTVATAQNSFQAHPIYLWLPVLGIALLVLSLSLLGDAIADAFNPQTRR
jgi:peptide/nickel transport system permease protein